MVFIEDEGAFGLFQPEENDIWRKDRSEMKGIFKREVPKHTTSCSSGTATTIHVIFFFVRNGIGILFCSLRGT